MTRPMKPFIPSQGIYWLMTLQTQLRSLSLALVGAAMMLTSVSIAQSYRGQRAGNISPRGRVQECNHAGAIVQDLGDPIFQDIDGGACVLNGTRFDEIDMKPNKQYGGAMVLNFSGMDLRNSSWIAVSVFTDLRPVFRGADASGANFSAMGMHSSPRKMGKAMKGVDATDFIATKTKWQGNVMEEWYLQGADFSGADLSSSQLIEWMTDEFSYQEAGDFGTLAGAESGNRQLNLSGSRFYNCTIDDCALPGTNFSDALVELTNVIGTEKNPTMLNGSNFESAYLKRTFFTNVNLSGVLMTKVRMENCRVESSNLAGASFSDAELTDCTFSQDCDFNGTSFKGADLNGVDFGGADLTNANLSGCSTTGLKGVHPQLPLDCRIEIDLEILTDTAGVATDTVITGTYSIVVNEGRYSDGLREKGN